MRGQELITQANEHVLICDCGGGTVDVTTYTVTQVEPRLTFDELCIGIGRTILHNLSCFQKYANTRSVIGGKCGSTYIDRNFHNLLSSRFGTAFDDISYAQKGPGSIFMRSFEVAKCNFEGNEDEGEDQFAFDIGPLDLSIQNSEHYDPDDQTVALS